MGTAQESLQEEALEATPKEKKGLPKLHVPKKRKKWFRWALAAAAAAALFWWLVLRPQGGDPMAGMGQYTVEPVSLRDLTAAVAGSGAVAPIESYQVSALARGEILDAPFEVGDWIEKGDLLYQLDAGEAETALEQARLALEQAQLSYDQISGGLRPAASRAGVVQKVHVKEGDLVSPGTPIADITDTSTMTVTLPFQSADAAGITPGQSAQVTVSGTLETLSGTVEWVSDADLVGAGGALVRPVRIRVDNPGALTTGHSATAVVGEAACAAGGNFEENSRQTVTAQGSGEITQVLVDTGSQVSAGSALAVIGGETVADSLESAALNVENARLSLQRAQDALADYTITSPISGTVIEKNYKAGDKTDGMESGALAVIFDLSSLKLQMNVSELNISQVKPGQEVEITAEALPGQTFRGVVDRVSINGTTTNGFTTYPVTIVLTQFGELNPGMNVSADIIVSRTQDALCVPVSAVNSDGTVLVAGDGALSQDGITVADFSKVERRSVTLGNGNTQYVEILSGLEEGERVLVPVQSAGGDAESGVAVVAAGG